MKKILVGVIITAIAIMMINGILPAVAQPYIQQDNHEKGHDSGIPLKYDPRSCDRREGTCTVFIDTNNNGCDIRDKTIEMPLQVIRHENIPTCEIILSE